MNLKQSKKYVTNLEEVNKGRNDFYYNATQKGKK